MAEEFEHAAPLHLHEAIRRNGNGNHHLRHGGLGEGIFQKIEHRLDRLTTMQGVLLAAGGVLALDWLLAPKGTSVVAETLGKVLPGGHHALGGRPIIPPPGAVPAAARGAFYSFPPAPGLVASDAVSGYYAGANLQAGWNRGMDPYGPWAVANPMVQYAHAAQGSPWTHEGQLGPFAWE